MKATIFSKATEHIHHLEVRNAHLFKEYQELRERVEAFESLLMSRSDGISNTDLNLNAGNSYH
jgi:hypothetical protein